MSNRAWIALLLLGLGCTDAPKEIHLGGASDSPAGSARAYFTTPDRSPADSAIVQALVSQIEQAKQSIDVAAFELDNKAIASALVQAVGRGVRIRLVCETDYLGESGVAALKAVGVPVVDDRRDGALMHNKFMVFDGKAVWTGSMNFTENCAYKNNNHGLLIDDARVAASYATKFSWMFEQRKFGGLPARGSTIPHPSVTLADGTPVEICFSTHDKIADKLTAKIREANKSVHFLAFSFTHAGMAQAMREAAGRGVEIQGVFEKSQAASGYSQFGKLKDVPGFEVHIDANPRNMHHKVLIIDGETVMAGSFNFSDSADKSNDENAVIFRSAALAGQFEEEFQRVLGSARKGGALPASIRTRR